MGSLMPLASACSPGVLRVQVQQDSVLPLVESSAGTVRKVSADLARTVFPAWQQEVEVSEMGRRKPGLHSGLLVKAYGEGPGWCEREVNDFRVTGGSEGETRAREGGGRGRDGSKSLDPQNQPWPSEGAVGRGEPLELCASQGTPFANSERVSLLTQLVKVRPSENVKGAGGEGRQLASWTRLPPRGTRGSRAVGVGRCREGLD